MYRNIFSFLGHRWIDEYALNELKNLPACYIVEVSTYDLSQPLPISEVTGKERNVMYVKIYYKSKAKDQAPYLFTVNKFVDGYIIDNFKRNCENRRRTKAMEPIRDLLLDELKTKKLRKQLKKRMLEVFRAEYESGAEFAGDNFLCHRNQYKRLGLRKMLEFVRQADEYGIDIIISFDIENADADQIERTMNDLELIDATVENEPLPSN